MFPCIGAPMMGSQPHFYGADPSLVDNFASGISPEKDKHAIFMHFEMVSIYSFFQSLSNFTDLVKSSVFVINFVLFGLIP